MKKILLLALLPVCGWTADITADLDAAAIKLGAVPWGPVEGTSITVLSGDECILGRLDMNAYTLNIMVDDEVSVDIGPIATTRFDILRHLVERNDIVGPRVRTLLDQKHQIQVVSGGYSHVLASDEDLARAVAAAPSVLGQKVLACEVVLEYQLNLIANGAGTYKLTISPKDMVDLKAFMHVVECAPKLTISPKDMVDLKAFMHVVECAPHGIGLSDIVGRYNVCNVTSSNRLGDLLKTDEDLQRALREAYIVGPGIVKVLYCRTRDCMDC